ncbi:MAG: methyl-accepting chemotaxis protein [Pseudomonadota bacterium]
MGSVMRRLSPQSLSVFGKIAALLIFSTAVVSLTLTFLGGRLTVDIVKQNLNDFALSATADLAERSGRAIRFSDQAELARLTEQFKSVAGERAHKVAILSADGALKHGSNGEGDIDPALLDIARSANDDLTQQLSPLTFFKVSPVLLGENATRVGTIAVLWSAEALVADVRRQLVVQNFIALGLFFLTLLVSGYLVKKTITKPLGTIGGHLGTIIDGDYDREVAFSNRQDELGTFARAIETLQERLKESRAIQQNREREQDEQQSVVSALRDGLNCLAEQDLTRTINQVFAEEYEELREDFNKGVNELRDIVSVVMNTTSTVRGGAEEISASSDDLARRTETQAAALEETSATLTEITQSVSESANTVREVEKIVLEAQDHTAKSDVVVQDAVGAMSEIEASSQQISSIISMIDDIAFQTNLLALNAGVEAARAGEAGRGFAVVATEVRTLAQRSADAAKEIKALITKSAEQVDRGVNLVRDAGDALSEISSQVSNISGLVSGIATSAGEQASGISEIATSVTQLENVTQQNAAMVEESTAAGHMLREQSAELAKLIGQFRVSDLAHGSDIGNYPSISAA